jgi:polyisoprenyl-teichoic acid--peptidoglycan teichoic acid transferase
MDNENFNKLPHPDHYDAIAAHNYQQGAARNIADEKTVELPRMAQNGPPIVPYNQQRVSPAGDRAANIPPRQQPPTMPPPFPPRPPRKTRKRLPLKVRISLTILVILLLLGGGTFAVGYYFYYTNVQAPLGKFIHPVSRGADEPNNNTIPSDSNVAGKVWNILLLGSDNDAKYSFPALLTQVMMVVHVDTINNTVSMLSIPRDSWVTVPEVGGMHKIDQAFFLGVTQHNSFDDGVRLARLTVEKDYGITIDRYAWVGLDGFAKVIDTLGGLDIDVTHPVVDDLYPDDTGANAHNPNAYTRLYIAPGPQHMDGQEALAYVRTRHADLVGDIGRTQRQQQVLEALKQKLNLSSVLNNLHQLFTDMNGSIYTDLSEQEMFGFAVFGRGINSNSIQHITLGPGSGKQDYGDYSSVYDPSVGSNQDVVIPNCQNIQPVINQVFGLGDVQSCNVTGG